jgi:uncharacterized membrane protein YeaQ/YmgE (transglycosylase-associated protein family)
VRLSRYPAAGLIAGWLAGQIMRGAGRPRRRYPIGIIGAFIGGWLPPWLSHLGIGLIA